MSENIIVVPKSKWPVVGFIVGVGLLFGLLVLGYLAYKKLFDENTKLRAEITEFKQLTETLVRSSNEWTTKKDLKEYLSNLLTAEDLKKLQKDINNQGSRISAVGRTIGVLSGRIADLEKAMTKVILTLMLKNVMTEDLLMFIAILNAHKLKELKIKMKHPLLILYLTHQKKILGIINYLIKNTILLQLLVKKIVVN